MLPLMDVRDLSFLVVTALATAVTASCTGDGAPERSVATKAPSASAEGRVSEAQGLCEDALSSPVAASSSATVGEVRDFEVGGPPLLTPDPNRRPARAAFPSAGRTRPRGAQSLQPGR